MDGSGFPKRSEVFAGNVSEPKTLKTMIQGLQKPHLDNADDRQKQLFEKNKPTIVMDAGIASEDNIDWLKAEHYPYIVVSRKKHREFSEDEAVEVKKDRHCIVKVQKVMNEKSDEVELYCHSSRREQKEKAIQDRFSTRLEEGLRKLSEGLNKKGCLRKYDKNGNRHLALAYVETANFMRRYCPLANAFYQRKTAKQNSIVATKALSNKICRASYFVMRDQVPYDAKKLFLR